MNIKKESKIALGTVQFGLDYGINNNSGQIPEKEIVEILNKSFNNGIDILDTSYAYGNSEELIGNCIKKTGHPYKIISKIPHTNDAPENILNQTLKNLGISHLYGYLLHHFSYYKEDPSIWEFMERKKKEGVFKKAGFSLYFPKELDLLIKNKVKFDLIQVPYNFFDRRFESYFGLLQDMGVEIHVRSVFLQGLFFLDPKKLPPFFNDVKTKLLHLKKIALNANISISSLCLCFVSQNLMIDRMVIGVDNSKNLDDNLNYINDFNKYELVKENIDQLIVTDEKYLLPFNWK